MATPLIAIYKALAVGTPTTGGTDGVMLSNGDRTVPKSIRLNCLINEISPPQKMAIRCANLYTTLGSTTINIVGATADMWALALDAGGTPDAFQPWGDPLVITTPVRAVNTIFWLKARASSAELPSLDSCCSLEIDCSVTLE